VLFLPVKVSYLLHFSELSYPMLLPWLVFTLNFVADCDLLSCTCNVCFSSSWCDNPAPNPDLLLVGIVVVVVATGAVLQSLLGALSRFAVSAMIALSKPSQNFTEFSIYARIKNQNKKF